jgi:hypothetical protein
VFAGAIVLAGAMVPFGLCLCDLGLCIAIMPPAAGAMVLAGAIALAGAMVFAGAIVLPAGAIAPAAIAVPAIKALPRASAATVNLIM